MKITKEGEIIPCGISKIEKCLCCRYLFRFKIPLPFEKALRDPCYDVDEYGKIGLSVVFGIEVWKNKIFWFRNFNVRWWFYIRKLLDHRWDKAIINGKPGIKHT